MKVRFWGTRGSTCASGPQFVEFGGHTPCVEVRCGERLFAEMAAFVEELSASGVLLATAPWSVYASSREHQLVPVSTGGSRRA